MKRALVFEAPRTGYTIGQIADGAITVGKLKEILEEFDDDSALFVLSHDNGYTYGSLDKWDGRCFVQTGDDEDDWMEV